VRAQFKGFKLDEGQITGGVWWLAVALFLTLASLALSDNVYNADCNPSNDLVSKTMPLLHHFTGEHLSNNLWALCVVSFWGLSCAVRRSDALAWAITIIVLNLSQAFQVGLLCVYGMSGALYGAVAIASLRLLFEPSLVARNFLMQRQLRGLTGFLRTTGALVLCGEFLLLSLISLRSIEHGGEKLHGHAAILVDQTSHWTGFLIGCTIAIINHFFLETDGGQVPS